MTGNIKNKSYDRLLNNSLSSFSTEDRPAFLPAAGYRNGTEVYNTGNNGNYWSSTPNESNSNNAYELNFNNGNNNWNNWNNRNNGQSVRPVSELTSSSPPSSSLFLMHLSPQELLVDLFRAYKDARRHKRRKRYQLEFELNYEEELVKLRDELIERRYKPGKSTCFIINDPKQREVFAADFRDRVVHHLYYNYTYNLFERLFIEDCYSCRKKKGTHYGFNRLQHHIRSVSHNYRYNCYVMKIDVQGYFMSINRSVLLDLCFSALEKMARRECDTSGKKWCEVLDYSLLYYLSEVIIMNDPVINSVRLGMESDWRGLPVSKSLFHTEKGCGLPIGNLTSQLFSNVYMCTFDSFVKRFFNGIAYGRYVDDAFFVSRYKAELRTIIPIIKTFLHGRLSLKLHPNKVFIRNIRHGVEFLGGYAKPYRCYISRSTLARIKRKLTLLESVTDSGVLSASLNSFLGVLSHYSSYRLKEALLGHSSRFSEYGTFVCGYSKYKVIKQNKSQETL